MKKNKIPYEVFTSEQANKRFPMFNFPAGVKVVFQKDGGTVFAATAVKTLKMLASKNGAVVLHNEKAVDIKVENDTLVRVKTESNKIFTAKNVVVTAGGWTKNILSKLNLDLPLTVTQEIVYYYEPKSTSKHQIDFLRKNMPTFIVHDDDKGYYGLPPIDIPGVKVGWHHRGKVIDVYKGKVAEDPENAKMVRNFVTNIFPELENTKPIKTLSCLYTTTTDHHFVIDRHPAYKNIIIGSACSGHGFKFGPAIGSLISALVLDETPALPLDEFSISRFEKPIKKRTGI